MQSIHHLVMTCSRESDMKAVGPELYALKQTIHLGWPLLVAFL